LFWDTGSFLELLSQRISSLLPHKNGIAVQIELRRDSFPFKQIQENIAASFEQNMRLKEIHIVLMDGVLSLVRGRAPSWLPWRDISNRSYFTDPKNGLMRFEFHFLDLTQPEQPLLAAVKDWHPPKTITPIHQILRTAREAKDLSLQDASQKLTQVLGYTVRKEKLADYEGDWDKAIPFDVLMGLAEIYKVDRRRLIDLTCLIGKQISSPFILKLLPMFINLHFLEGQTLQEEPLVGYCTPIVKIPILLKLLLKWLRLVN